MSMRDESSSLNAKENFSIRLEIEMILIFVLVISAFLAAIATFLAINDSGPFPFTRETVRPLLALDALILIALVFLLIRRLLELWVDRRRGYAGSKLQSRIVGVVSLITLIPTVIVSLGSVLFINRGVEVWFSESTSKAINQSVIIAEAYVFENRKNIESDVRAVASQMEPRLNLLRSGQERAFTRALTFFSKARGLTEAIVIDGNQVILSASPMSETLTTDGPFDVDVFIRAKSGEVVLTKGSNESRVRALKRLDVLTDTYLVVGRLIDPQVLGYAERVRSARAEYEKLESDRSGLEIGLAMVFVLMALLMLSIAILFGLLFTKRLVRPISDLVKATARVRSGNLSTRVPEGNKDDEFGTLSRAFNRMTSQLQEQRNELIDANQLLDTRRRFTETILAGVSSGVIALDNNFTVVLPNKPACQLLDSNEKELIGKSLKKIIPELGQLLDKSFNRSGSLVEGEVSVTKNNIINQYFVRVVGDKQDDIIKGYVITLDDISELVSAQRRAAWSDIARRIAHEIKNPLTPIKLSADRLKRKYGNQIHSDIQTFNDCTDSIIRQVDEIGRMVNEFSNFARMPAPEFRKEDLSSLIKEVYFIEKQTYPDIKLDFTSNEKIEINCDRQQISRALINVVKNAAEAIINSNKKVHNPEINILLEVNKYKVVINVEDNGPGFPLDKINQLTEPYVTSRAGGTGLGLAIVKKIVEDHDGSLLLENILNYGARTSLIFYLEEKTI
ncbi:PAS domain-containing sensor histidine kinase [Alphaproteobacteria bacterium]|nr:PAS domain-containing sensor histidine kinase [Alphaproteobacteria bacterium]